MDKTDWITFLLAIGIVIGMALIMHPPDFGESQTPAGTGDMTDTDINACPDGSCCMPKIHYKYDTNPQTEAYRIYYSYDLDEIYSPGTTGYPRLTFPKSLINPSGDLNPPDQNIYYKSTESAYGSSDIFPGNIWQSGNITTFAYLEENTGGFSSIFGVPYQLWRIRSSMVPKGNPAYSSLLWMLVDSKTGDIIAGGNVLPGEEIIKKVDISNINLYFMIEAENVESFKIELETPEVSYDEAHLNPTVSELINFLNTMEN